jgi:hypothetical protein
MRYGLVTILAATILAGCSTLSPINDLSPATTYSDVEVVASGALNAPDPLVNAIRSSTRAALDGRATIPASPEVLVITITGIHLRPEGTPAVLRQGGGHDVVRVQLATRNRSGLKVLDEAFVAVPAEGAHLLSEHQRIERLAEAVGVKIARTV